MVTPTRYVYNRERSHYKEVLLVVTKEGVSTYYHTKDGMHDCFDEFFHKLPTYDVAAQRALIEALQRQLVKGDDDDYEQWEKDFNALRDVTPLFIVPDCLWESWECTTNISVDMNRPELCLIEFEY